MGIFSFNYHKHIHTGEGGMIVTDDDNLAERCRLIRNHAEAVVEAKDEQNLVNMIGFNFRMPEIEAAIGRCQLKKLDSLLHKRITNVRYIEKGLSSIPAIHNPKTRENCTHVYYGHACQFDKKVAGVERNRFMEAVKAELAHHTLREEEGVQLGCGYVKPLYLMPIFQQRIAYGSKGYPFNLSDVTYNKGLAPICEQLHFEKLFTHEFMLPSMQEKDMDDVIKAFHKVWELRTTL